MNPTRLWDAELECYSLDLLLWLGSWPWNPQFYAYLANWAKFLEPSSCCTVVNFAFAFHTTKVFDCFCSVMAQFELVKYKFLNKTAWHVHLSSFQITHSEAMHNMSAHQLPQYYQPQWAPPIVWTTSVVRYMLQSSTYQNIANLLTHPNIYI